MSNDEKYFKSESHRYWANSIGFVAFCALLGFGMYTCSNIDSTLQVEKEKTKQIQIINNCANDTNKVK